MSKKLILLLSVLVILIISTMIFLSRQKPKTLTPVSDKPVTSHQQPVTKTKEYLDPSGFKFSYPENLKLTPKKIETETIYSDLLIKSPGKKGQISLKVEDITEAVFNQLIKNKNSIKTVIDEVDAYQYQDKNNLITVAYDQGVIFKFVADQSQDKKYWFAVNKKILTSFRFVQPEQPATSNQQQTTEDDVIFEGEEVIE